MILHVVVMTPFSSIPIKPGAEHVGVSPDQARNHHERSAVMYAGMGGVGGKVTLETLGENGDIEQKVKTVI